MIAGLIFLVQIYLPSIFLRASEFLKNIARRPVLPIVISAFVPLVLRLAMLPVIPAPTPKVHDEFGHLLVAETLLQGRLANPPHPFAEHMETIYVIQKPTYSSIYPLGQGAILAIGKLFAGSYWAGVLLSVAAMCGCICWMLRAWVSPLLAMTGGIVAGLAYCVSTYWMNSFWGGSLCAFGGALVFGSLPRFVESLQIRYAALLGCGWAIVWFTRPFEALGMAVFGCVALGLWSLRSQKLALLFMKKAALPLIPIVASVGAMTAYHNWRVTGSPMMTPYHLIQRTQGVPQGFLWQPLVPPPNTRFRNILQMYEWQRNARLRLESQFLLTRVDRLVLLWGHYVDLFFSLPLLVTAFRYRSHSGSLYMGFLLIGAFIWSAFYPFLQIHYFAAYTSVLSALVYIGMEQMANWKFRQRHVGFFLAVILVNWALLAGLRNLSTSVIRGSVPPETAKSLRHYVEQRLLQNPGQHLVFVRYGPNHSFFDEWVFNSASIDSARIAWARELSTDSDQALSKYFQDRSVWAVYPEEKGRLQLLRQGKY